MNATAASKQSIRPAQLVFFEHPDVPVLRAKSVRMQKRRRQFLWLCFGLYGLGFAIMGTFITLVFTALQNLAPVLIDLVFVVGMGVLFSGLYCLVRSSNYHCEARSLTREADRLERDPDSGLSED